MRLLLSAGEASGEHYGAQLIEALRRRRPDVECFGMGGERMRQAGCELVVDARHVAVVGLTEVVRHMPRIYGEYRKLLRAVDQHRPDAAVLIDFPDFNFRLARQLRRRGIPVIYFISPQLWAWRKGRIRLVQKYVDKMLVIFPFEEKFYREHGVEVEYVGHPLADAPQARPSRQEYARRHDLDPGKAWITLMPGSRKGEVQRHLRTLLQAAARLGSAYDFLVPVAATLEAHWLEALVRIGLRRVESHDAKVTLVDDAWAALAHSRAAVVASGTATVQAALAGTPFVMVYRVAASTWAVGRRLVDVPHYAMVNLIAGERIVPELVQNDFSADNVLKELTGILAEGPTRANMLAGLARVQAALRGGDAAQGKASVERAADAVLATLG